MASLSDLDILALQVEALFTQDARRRLLRVNKPDGGVAPRFFLGRTAEGNLWRFRHDLPDALINALEERAQSEPIAEVSRQLPRYWEEYRRLLQAHGEIQAIYRGPAYLFPEKLVWPDKVTAISQTNAHLLPADYASVIHAMEKHYPCVAIVEDGKAVSICFSSRLTESAAEAGLETLADYRGRGYATQVTTAWAIAVRESGRLPLYSTPWENTASQGVAQRLGLRLYAEDLHIT